MKQDASAEPETLRASLRYYPLGWSMIPLRADDPKRPKCKWKRFQAARATDTQLRSWFADPSLGLAVVFGEVSGGLISRDFDTIESYDAWQGDFPRLAETLPTVETRRGRHVYCRVDPAEVAAYRRLMGKPAGTGAIEIEDGELRAGVGCYSAIPPTIHPSGHRYRWIIPVEGEVPKLTLAETGFVSCNIDPIEHIGVPRGLRTLTEYNSDDSPPTRQLEPCPEFSLSSMASMGSMGSMVHDSIQRAIAVAIPSCEGRRHRMIFELCRQLKSIPDFADKPARSLKQVFRLWHKASLPYISTKDFETSWWDFCEGWDKVRIAAGSGPLGEAFKRALTSIPDCAKQYDRPEVRLLVSLCRELSRHHDGGPFFLTVRAAGELLQVDHSTVSRWLRGLGHDGIVKCVSKGSHETKQASYYRYLGTMD